MALLLPQSMPDLQAELPPSSFLVYCSSDKYQGHKVSLEMLETAGAERGARAERDVVLVPSVKPSWERSAAGDWEPICPLFKP